MADFLADLAVETSSTQGTGTYALDGAVSGLRTIVAALGTGVTGEFVARSATYSKWERFRGVITDGSPDTLTRAEIFESNNSGAAIDWQAGDAPIYIHCIPSARRLSQLRANHRGASAPANPLQAGMIWIDTSGGVTAVVIKYYDGTDWLTFPWVINETANTITIGAVTLAGTVTLSGNAGPSLLAGLVTFQSPGHRLSLTTAVPVTVSDVTGAGTIYWTPRFHNVSPIWNGSAWILAAIAEKSFILDATNHTAGNAYDAFLDYNAGTPRIVTGPAWSSGTARSAAISRDATYGWLVNTGSMTARISNNGGTVNIAAGAGLYLGSFYCFVNAQIEDTLEDRMLWNMYNRVPRAMRRLEPTDSWTYSTASYRQANNSSDNQLTFFRGLDEDAAHAEVLANYTNGDGNPYTVRVAVGLDSSTTIAGVAGTAHATSSSVGTPVARYSGFPGLGLHSLRWLESGAGASTQTWFGDNGTPTVLQTGMTGMVMA